MSLNQQILIATIMREYGETGVQTHFNNFKNYLLEKKNPVKIITPFCFWKWLAFPVFGLRKIIDPISGELSVWWYRYWHYIFLKQALIKTLTNIAKKDNYVVIYAQCPLAAKAALIARKSEQQKVIMVVHFNISQADEWAEKKKINQESWIYRQIQKLEHQIIPQLNGIIYVSRYSQEIMEKKIPETANMNSIILHNFIQEPTQLEREKNYQKINRDLINIGSLEPRKNQSYLLQVLAETKKLGKSYSLTLVGDGTDRNKLTALALELGIAEQVKFLGFQKNACQFLWGHSIYVHSALMESMGIVLVEAMACGLPVLAPAVGGIPEVFSDGVEGFYWPLNNPLMGAKKLIALMENTNLRKEMGAAAKSRFFSTFESNIVGGKLLNFLIDSSAFSI
ncbi:MAG: glycosyltransferase family 4 protein [Trichodesmium sp.]